jgi:3'-phosphoadenosine 5'-phosphosulfate sulfotransferase (PAPS reductase)/FAD synthetase
MATLPCTLADWAALGIVGQVHRGQPVQAYPYRHGLARKTALAQRLIADWWAHVQGQGYVCLSFGKDSLVTWHLAQQVAPIPAVFIALGPLCDWPDCLALRAVLEAEYGLRVIEVPAMPSHYDRLVLQQRAGHHHGWSTCAETIERFHTAAPHWQGALWGLRGVNEPHREGIHREILFRTHGLLYQRQRDQRWMGAPVGWWTNQEIWAYIDAQALPYPAMYDIDRTSLRNGPPFTFPGEALGRVRKIRQAFPAIFRVVESLVPEAYYQRLSRGA